MKKYKYAIFDLDGTLLDTIKDLADAVNVGLKTCGAPCRTVDEVRQMVGNGVKNLVKRALPDNLKESEFDTVFSEFKKYYALHSMDNTLAYDGIPELLKSLEQRGIKTAVVSNKLDSAVKSLCKEFFPAVTCAIGEREGIARKPSPDSVLTAMAEIGASASETVYIGDSEVDVATAKNTGLDCISVLWGFRDKKTLINSGAKTFVTSPEELLEYFD